MVQSAPSHDIATALMGQIKKIVNSGPINRRLSPQTVISIRAWETSEKRERADVTLIKQGHGDITQ